MKRIAMLAIGSMFVLASFTACKKQEAPAPAPAVVAPAEAPAAAPATAPAAAPAAPAPAEHAK